MPRISVACILVIVLLLVNLKLVKRDATALFVALAEPLNQLCPVLGLVAPLDATVIKSFLTDQGSVLSDAKLPCHLEHLVQSHIIVCHPLTQVNHFDWNLCLSQLLVDNLLGSYDLIDFVLSQRCIITVEVHCTMQFLE